MGITLKLIHLANFNSTNIGNGALISGLERLFAEDFPLKIQWRREPWDDYTFGFRRFNRRFVDLVNAHDGLIVNGAVAIHGREYLRETGMRFELPLALMAEVKKPVVFYGISYRHFHGQPFRHNDKLAGYLEALASRKDVFLGVRNDGTLKWLAETLRLAQPVLNLVCEVPDSGVFVTAQAVDYPEIIPGRPLLLFSPNDEDAPYRYGDGNRDHVRETGYGLQGNSPEPDASGWQANRKRLVLALRDAFTEILTQSGAQLLLVPHYLDDLKFIADLVDSLAPQIGHQAAIATGLMRVAGTGFFYGRYTKANLAMSMRVHSMSPCIGLGVPMIPLITQPRMWDFLQAAGLDDLGLDAFSADLANVLARESKRVLTDPGERKSRFRQARAVMREQAKNINFRIFRMF